MDLYLCRPCQRSLPRDAFGTDNQKTDGRRRSCRECDKKARRANWAADLEKSHQAARAYREANSEKVAQRKRRYQQSPQGRLKTNALHRNWTKTERGRKTVREKDRRWRKTEKGLLASRIWCAQRRARLAQAPGKFTAPDWTATLERQQNLCHYCRVTFSETVPPTIDHVIPITKGGAHSPENVVAACRPCNSRKWNHV